ncbi:MAG: uroporphyrinogen decarboxylase family protein [Planctomycetota bacterium]
MQMPYRGCTEDVRRAARGERPRRMPVFLCSEEFDVRLAGETYERAATDSRVLAGVLSETIRRFDYDWAWVQVDDCIVYETLGVGVKGGGNILFATCEYLPASADTLKGLTIPRFEKAGRCPVLLDACKRLKDEFGDEILVVGRTEAPFSSVTLTYGIEATMMLMFDNPQLLKDTLEFFVELQTEFGIAQKEAGADALWYGDCNASSHLMGLGHYREFAAPALERVAKEYRKNDILTILHASEENADYVDVMAGLGVDFVSIGPGGDLAECYRRARGRCALTGNVDPIGVLMNGTPEDVRSQTRSILKTVSVRGGHLINSGEMVPRDCPEENIRAYVETVHETWKEITQT